MWSGLNLPFQPALPGSLPPYSPGLILWLEHTNHTSISGSLCSYRSFCRNSLLHIFTYVARSHHCDLSLNVTSSESSPLTILAKYHPPPQPTQSPSSHISLFKVLFIELFIFLNLSYFIIAYRFPKLTLPPPPTTLGYELHDGKDLDLISKYFMEEVSLAPSRWYFFICAHKHMWMNTFTFL